MTTVADEPAWLSPKRAAKVLDMHPEEVREKMRRGELRATKPAGRWYTTREWCNAYMLGGEAA